MNNTQTHTPTANDAIWRAMEQSGSSPDYIQAHLSQPPVADSKPLRSIVVAVAPEILADCLSQGNYAWFSSHLHRPAPCGTLTLQKTSELRIMSHNFPEPVTGDSPFPTGNSGILHTSDDPRFRAITGSLRSEHGTSYTWSVKAFKRWKKDFKSLFRKRYWQDISELVPDASQRERLYKSILGMQGFDVFRNGHTEGILRIEDTLISTCKTVASLLESSNASSQ